MVVESGKYGIWLSEGEMNTLEKALEWLENSSHVFNQNSKIGSIKNLRNDLSKIRDAGVQIPKRVEIQDEEYINSLIECKECD